MSNPNNQSTKGNVLPIMLFAGESRGEQGQGAAAAIILMPNGKRFTVSQLLSFTTTEEAEYHGLVIGLRKSLQLGIQSLEVKGNSETIFNQVNGLTDVQNDKSRILFREVIRLMRQFERVSVEWISAEQNRSARNAVRRCIEEALGRDNPFPTSRVSVSISEEVARLIQLGSQATDQDFLQVGKELDHFSLKTLSELRPLVPIAVQDVIALKWSGDEEELAQMYRWFLRGLPPDMAIRRVELERQSYESPTSERLPWEGQLLGSRDTLPNDSPSQDNTTNLSFISLGENIDMGSIEMRRSDVKSFTPKNPTSPSAIVSPLDTLESVFAFPNEDDNLPSMSLFPPVTASVDPFSTLGAASTEPPPEIGDRSRDTLPSGDRVQQAISMLLHFSDEEKAVFMYELIQIPELATQVLSAIAAKLKRS